MSDLPLLEYASGEEMIFERHRGFVPLTRKHYLEFDNLCYNTIWSIGCPFRCTYCGNTKFIANDQKYRRLRHPPVETIVSEIEQAVERNPHVSSVMFHDDTLERTTDGRGNIADLDLGELRELDAGFRFIDPDSGSTPYRGRGLRVPTLEEAFAAFPETRFNLEIKAASRERIELTLDVALGELSLLEIADDRVELFDGDVLSQDRLQKVTSLQSI